MPKTVISPVKHFSGHVILHDPLNFLQLFTFGDALDNARAIEAEQPEDMLKINYALLPGVLACVAEWRLLNFPEQLTVENFPATPPVSTARLIAWLVGEISALYQEADEVPLAY